MATFRTQKKKTFIFFGEVLRFFVQTLFVLHLSTQSFLTIFQKSLFFIFFFVGQRSGTGLDTPLLGLALPLRILNHMSLGADVPLFHPGENTLSFSVFSS